MGLWGKIGLGDGPAGELQIRALAEYGMEMPSIEGDSPVGERARTLWVFFPSTTGHGKSCGKLPGPPGKAKYSLATDSELVP